MAACAGMTLVGMFVPAQDGPLFGGQNATRIMPVAHFCSLDGGNDMRAALLVTLCLGLGLFVGAAPSAPVQAQSLMRDPCFPRPTCGPGKYVVRCTGWKTVGRTRCCTKVFCMPIIK
jgi:hypothetical protein